MKKKMFAVFVVIVILSLLTGCGPRAATAGDLIVPVAAAELTPSPAAPTLAQASAETPTAPATVVSATVALAMPASVDSVGTAVAATLTALPTTVKSAPTLVSTPTPTKASSLVASASITGTYPALTMADVAPLIAKFGTGGNPSHDVAGNLQCAYWLSPRFLLFADDTGPNTSGIETASEGVFEFDLGAISKYKDAPADGVFVIEGAYIEYMGQKYESAFVVTNSRDKVLVSGGAVFLLPNPLSVDPFVTLRVEHLKCRGYQNQVVDYRGGKVVVSTPAVGSIKTTPPSASKTPVSVPTSAPVASGVNATYSFGTLTGTVNKAVCVELKGASGTLSVALTSGGFATSGRVDASTDWLLAKSSGVGKYATSWSGWLLCFDANADQAVASLVATDGNAKSNQRITWSPK